MNTEPPDETKYMIYCRRCDHVDDEMSSVEDCREAARNARDCPECGWPMSLGAY